MPTQITQLRDEERGFTILRVDGDMLREDAVLIGRIVSDLVDESPDKVVLDLADLDFLDSEAASILRKLKDTFDVDIEGVEIFLQSAIDMAERA